MRADVFVPADELHMYRSHTLGLLRRYFRMSLEAGRLPALLGREIFRARVQSSHRVTFEDLVIFVTDVEHSLARLTERQQQVIARVALQEYTFDEAAALLGWPRRTMARQYFHALDRLSAVLLERGLLRPFVFHEKPCQGAKNAVLSVKASAESEYSFLASGTIAPCGLVS